MIEFRSKAVLALGGNQPSDVGSPAITLICAVTKLCAEHAVIRSVSRFYATPCFPAGTGPDYVNAVICVDSTLNAPELLRHLHDVENFFGRARTQRWGMRTLDLDVLAIEQTVLPDFATQRRWQNLLPADQIETTPDQLILPHPRLQDRAFVLVPMVDVAPDWMHPVLHKTALELLGELPQEEIDAVCPL